MLRNYLITALRNIARNRLYAAINIVGLAVGFAAALLIALYVRDELSYDKWLPGHERTYLIYEHIALRDRPPITVNVTFSDIAKWLETEFPDVQSTARLERAGFSLRRGEVESVEPASYWADPNIFALLPLTPIAGDLGNALSQPDGIVLTRSTARKYFGRDMPVGESIEIDRAHTMQVKAVIEDLPSNTHLAVDVFASGLASFSDMAQQDAVPANGKVIKGENYYTYVRLRPGAAIKTIADGMPAFAQRHKPQLTKGDDFPYTFKFVPLADIHFYTPSPIDMKSPSNLNDVLAMMVVGVLIMFAASVNFVNLMTARSMRSAVEVGVRKALGARRHDLIVQFIGGSMIYVALGMMLAIVGAALLLPRFNAFLDRSIVIDFWRSPGLVFAGLALTGVVGFLAGLYPAFVLSAFRPALALRGMAARNTGSSRTRQFLVVLQFAILTGLVLATTVIYRQTVFATRERLRTGNEQILQVATNCHNAFASEVRKIAGVQMAACSSRSAVQIGRIGTMASVPGRARVDVSLRVNPADPEFFDLFGLPFLAGHTYAPEAQTSSDEGMKHGPPVVINETALRFLGFPSAEGAVGATLTWKRFLNDVGQLSSPIESPIVGVVPDFSLGSVRDAVEPSLYYYEPFFAAYLNIKLRGAVAPEVLAAIESAWRRMGEPRPLLLAFLDQRIQGLYRDIQRQGSIFGVFAVVAIFIACLGLLGLSALTAEQRTKEIGIRKSMGATRADILRLILWQFTKPVLWANVIAWPAAYLIMHRWLEGFAYHIDLAPRMFLAASALALIIAVFTVIGHALLVARAKPVTALRYE